MRDEKIEASLQSRGERRQGGVDEFKADLGGKKVENTSYQRGGSTNPPTTEETTTLDTYGNVCKGREMTDVKEGPTR